VIGWPVVVVHETVMNLRQIFHASFLRKFLAQVSDTNTSFLRVCRWHKSRCWKVENNGKQWKYWKTVRFTIM